MDSNVLTKAGLTEKEAKVYITLMTLGECKAHKIIKKTSMQRSVVYPILDKLISLGLISYVIKNNVKYFQIDNPEAIKNIMEENLKEISNFINQIKKLKEGKDATEIRIYEGYNGIKNLLDNRINKIKKGGEVLIINSRDVFLERNKKYLDLFHNHMLKREVKKIKQKIIYYKEVFSLAKEKAKQKLCEEKWINLDSPIGIVVYHNYTEFYIWPKKEIVIQIEDKELANSYRKYFQVLWKQAKF